VKNQELSQLQEGLCNYASYAGRRLELSQLQKESGGGVLGSLSVICEQLSVVRETRFSQFSSCLLIAGILRVALSNSSVVRNMIKSF